MTFPSRSRDDFAPALLVTTEERVAMLSYGFFEWAFWALAIGAGLMALIRGEVFSTNTSQRTHHHSGQQILLWVLTATFALAGFVTAVLAMRAGH